MAKLRDWHIFFSLFIFAWISFACTSIEVRIGNTERPATANSNAENWNMSSVFVDQAQFMHDLLVQRGPHGFALIDFMLHFASILLTLREIFLQPVRSSKSTRAYMPSRGCEREQTELVTVEALTYPRNSGD